MRTASILVVILLAVFFLTESADAQCYGGTCYSTRSYSYRPNYVPSFQSSRRQYITPVYSRATFQSSFSVRQRLLVEAEARGLASRFELRFLDGLDFADEAELRFRLGIR